MGISRVGRLCRILVYLTICSIFLVPMASAGRLLGLEDATLRINGVDFGKPDPASVKSGWRGAYKSFNQANSEYLYFDLSKTQINSREGSILITVLRDEFDADMDEALISFSGADWSEKFGLSTQWNNGGKVIVTAFGELLDVLGRMPYLPEKGQPMTAVFAWKDDLFQVWVNGALERLQMTEGANNATFASKMNEVRYLVIGAINDKRFPAGAWNQMSSKLVNFGVYETFEGWQVESALSEVASDKTIYGPGQKIKVILKGEAGSTATFTVAGLVTDGAMKETSPGLYEGETIVPNGLNIASAELTGYIIFKGEKLSKIGKPLTIDSTPPAAPPNVLASAQWGSELELAWDASQSKDVSTYKIFRSVGIPPVAGADPYNETSALRFTDNDVIPGLTYYYAVAAVDKADNTGTTSEVASAKVLQGEGPAISKVLTDPLNKPMRPGQTITFSIKGATRGSAKVDILGLNKSVTLVEVGASGVYTGSYLVENSDSAATTTAFQVVGVLTDDFSTSKFAGPQLIVVGRDILGDSTAPKIVSVDHDGYKTAGFSGKLVVGDVLTVTIEGEPKGFASFSLVGVTAQQAMNETSPGVYKGSYTIGWTDEGVGIPVEASLSDLAGNETRAVSTQIVEVDTRVRISVTANDLLLPADKASKTRIVVKTSNANGDDVSGHEVMLKLHTTDEYTGVVGGGKVANKFASKDDEDDIEVKWGGVTDSFGEIAATYTAGFAAKTALIIAKDITSGDIGAGWLNTYVASTVSIQLVPASAREATIAPVLRMSVTPGWLTADGRSKARVRAWLTESDGTPIKGARVRFELATDNGSIKTLRGVTDAQGMAEGEYRAGTLAGMVSILANATDDKVSSSVQIELKSDAPAKIALVSAVVSLPADGRSTSKLRAYVTDINDNPNKQSPVVFSIAEGSGNIEAKSAATDDRGYVESLYTAGRTVGTTIIEARHTSRAPTVDELRRVYGTIFIPKLTPDFGKDRIRLDEWYVKPGASVVKGQALVKISSKGQSWLLHAQEDGVLANQIRHKKDYVELGDTIGYVEIADSVWKANYSK